MALTLAEFEHGKTHPLTVRHRLGVALGAGGNYAKAREVLHSVAADLIYRLGNGNPVSCELNFMISLMALKRAEASRAVDPADKGRLLGEMARSLEMLREYGQEHMLVKTAERQFKEAGGTPEHRDLAPDAWLSLHAKRR